MIKSRLHLRAVQTLAPILLLLGGTNMTQTFAASLQPAELRCEDRIHPLGIDIVRPGLTWTLKSEPGARGVRQTSYQVVVSTALEGLDRDQGDLWDSGWINSARSSGLTYDGKEIGSGHVAYWKVRVRDEAGSVSPWSSPARWTTGLLVPDDWKPARWISSVAEPAAVNAVTRSLGVARGPASKQPASMRARLEFDCASPIRRALVFVSGLGEYELSINGQKVGDALLSPGWTNYRRTVLYDTFDVTAQLRVGPNAIGLITGNGVYHIEPTDGRYVKYTNSFGPQKAIAKLQIEYADGSTQTVATDREWQIGPSPITYANEFGGEDHDARLEQEGWDQASFRPTIAWTPAIETDGPGGTLRGLSAAAPEIRAIETRPPIKVSEPSPNVTVYDLGQNASFMPRLTVNGPAGSYVRTIPSELLGKNGYVDRASAVQDKGGPAWWQYTLAGRGENETHFPKFFYQGCRYLQVERFAAGAGGALPTVVSIEGAVVHSSAEPVGTFECSNELFNKIYSLVRWAQRSNMMSLMTDCPQREKLGWLEELHLNGPALRYNFALENLFAKQMNDMADSQLENGFVPNIAPEYFLAHTERLNDPFRASPEWGSSFVIVPWQQYLFTGDPSLLRRHYKDMVRYVDHLGSTAKDGILNVGLGDWYDLGPKPPWGSQLTPPAFTATAIYYYDHCILAKAADLLGQPEDAARFRQGAERIRDAFNTKFFDRESGRYSTGSQCTSAMPLVLGLVRPEHRDAVLKALIDDVRAKGNALTAGDVGYRFVLRALADAGRSDVVFDMNNQTERPGYGMQIKKGATSLTEKWDASVGSFGSQNHFMLGQINEWFFHDLAGIRMDEASPGFEKIVIKPAMVGDITWVKCGYKSVKGQIDVAWRRDGDSRRLDVDIPPNTSATVYVPAGEGADILEGGQPAAVAHSVAFAEKIPGYVAYRVGSGSYSFTSK